MSENFVGREEFNSLKNDVQKLKDELNESKAILQQIDKKCDVITERISNSDKIDELKLKPLNERVSKLEENHIWLSRTVLATIIGILIKLIVEVSKYIKV